MERKPYERKWWHEYMQCGAIALSILSVIWLTQNIWGIPLEMFLAFLWGISPLLLAAAFVAAIFYVIYTIGSIFK